MKIALIDDHILLRKSLAELLVSQNYQVLFEASNGVELQEKINKNNLPNVVLMDIAMPVMDGFAATKWLSENYPQVNVLALSMNDTELNIIKMLRLGVKGYLLKDCNPLELFSAIDTVGKNEFHFSELVNPRFVNAINQKAPSKSIIANTILNLTTKEMVFLKHCSTEMSYKEIATAMSISPKTVEGYREELFKKCDVKTRVGLVMYAVKSGLV